MKSLLLGLGAGIFGAFPVYAIQWTVIRHRATKLYPGQPVGIDPRSVLKMRSREAVTVGVVLFSAVLLARFAW